VSGGRERGSDRFMEGGVEGAPGRFVSGDAEDDSNAVSRRGFLARGGALVLGVGLGACALGETPRARVMKVAEAVRPEAAEEEPVFAPDAFLRISSDGTVTVVSKHLEMGQGAFTGLATLVAEELDADWSRVRVVSAPADEDRYANLLFGSQATGGSTTIRDAHLQMRTVGASARQMLVGAASERWRVPVAEIQVVEGEVRHPPSGRASGFGELAAAAAMRPVPVAPALKSPADFRLIGQEGPRVDTAAKSDGSAQFTIDAWREDMLTVVIERPPLFGARVARFEAEKAKAVPGVVGVESLPQGVAVYAEETWAAIQGRRALQVEWDDRDAETRSTEDLYAVFRQAASRPGRIAAERGDATRAIESGGERDDVFTAEAEYLFPFLAHASMEPLDALIEIDPEGDGEGVLVTMASQGPGRDRPALAARLGLAQEQVRLDVQMAGGSFGRRSQHDAHFPVEVADVFRSQPGTSGAPRPTKVLWTREDDLRGGYYRPMVVHRLRGALSRSGALVGWEQTIAAQSFQASLARAGRLPGGIDRTVVEGANNLAYATADLRVTQQLVETGVPVLWWRSVGHTHTGFAVEAFLDELLEGAGQDAVEGRMALLKDRPRHRGVLARVAEMAGWGGASASGRALGVAVHESFGSFVAQIAEVEVETSGVRRPRVRRVWCAVDCGLPVNPNVIRAQMEGAIGFGLGAALYGEIHLDAGGRVRERNFDTYRNLRIDEMPEVEVSVLASEADPTGVGEPGVPPIAPAVANAWRRLTGERVSRLPFVRTS